MQAAGQEFSPSPPLQLTIPSMCDAGDVELACKPGTCPAAEGRGDNYLRSAKRTAASRAELFLGNSEVSAAAQCS